MRIAASPARRTFALRDYGCPGQIGLEKSPDEYVARLVEVFRELRRVLHDAGTLWLNIGDSYSSGGRTTRDPGQTKHHRAFRGEDNRTTRERPNPPGVKPKDRLMIPARVALALQADGWYLRDEIVWHKPAPMPSSVRDRTTAAHEMLYLLAKSPRYYFDSEAIAERASTAGQKIKMADGWDTGSGGHGAFHRSGREKGKPNNAVQAGTRNKRSVWKIATQPFKGSHFATFPKELVTPCVLAGTSAKGCCPECGAPWVRRKAVWQPGCGCGGDCNPSDLEVIATPTGERVGDDPTLLTGRHGFNRPRGPDGGTRPITRYEQRKYAAQLKGSPHRTEMAAEAGPAFDHYLRTDRSGARPIPPELLAAWVERGWLVPVEPPAFNPLPPVPCVVLDPFMGSGTVAAVAVEHGRRAVGCELNPKYLGLIARRMSVVNPSLFSGDA